MSLQPFTDTLLMQTTRLAVNMPDVPWDFNNPFVKAATKIAGIVLGVGAILCVIGAAACIIALIFAQLSPHRKEQATTGLIWCLIGVVALGSITGIIGWAINFNFFG